MGDGAGQILLGKLVGGSLFNMGGQKIQSMPKRGVGWRIVRTLYPASFCQFLEWGCWERARPFSKGFQFLHKKQNKI